MKRIPGSLLFISTAIYLTIQSDMNIITSLAVITCAVCGAIALSDKTFLAVVGGVGLITVSLALQIILNQYCQTCLKADLLILSAILCIAFFQEGSFRKPAQWLAGCTTIIFLLAVLMATPNIGMAAPTVASKNIVVQHNDQDVLIDTEKTPLLIFSPNCPACKKELKKLVETDKEINWQPVVSSSSPDQVFEAKRLLDSLGYTGELYTTNWGGTVPTVIFSYDGVTKVEHTVNSLLPHT